MIGKTQAHITQIAVHYIGNPSAEESLVLTDQPLEIQTEEDHQHLIQYLLGHFKEPIYYQLGHPSGDHILNPMYTLVQNIFTDPGALFEMSIPIAKILQDVSSHPLIKSGELLVAHIRDVIIEERVTEAVAIFKSEQKDAFARFHVRERGTEFDITTGKSLEKLDKACLILDIDEDHGYRVLNVDHLNKSSESLFWRNDFLHLVPKSDDFHHTQDVIRITQKFLQSEHERGSVQDKTEKVAVMKKTKKYLEQAEEFDLDTYKAEVFDKPHQVADFEQFMADYQKDQNKTIANNFQIDAYALKKESKVFKSIIKLDKNFHIYVHGDHTKIVKGEEPDGRKYYKLYYEEEK